ncbi:MAG: SRPBCC domain-containing protein [Gemmatimonadales bacterium]|nr:SRPBCC domain-containing protein [Gemmatimonadales bacterium]
MTDILHDFPIAAPADRVFDGFTTPTGLDQWWTKRSAGEPRLGAVYELWFGPEYDWRGRVTRCEPGRAFELEMIAAAGDWLGTRVGVELEAGPNGTQVRFYHRGWPAGSEHCRVSSFCWAMYLRVLRRHLEHGESVPYEGRLEV